jgi:hypothetical protein
MRSKAKWMPSALPPETLQVGDIVLCKVNGKQYLHPVKAIQRKRFQIGNNRGRINGCVGESSIFGKCTRVECVSASGWHFWYPTSTTTLPAGPVTP